MIADREVVQYLEEMQPKVLFISLETISKQWESILH
jgi:hypothetical protein